MESQVLEASKYPMSVFIIRFQPGLKIVLNGFIRSSKMQISIARPQPRNGFLLSCLPFWLLSGPPGSWLASGLVSWLITCSRPPVSVFWTPLSVVIRACPLWPYLPLSIHLCLSIFIHLPIISGGLSIHLSIHSYIHLFVRLSVHLFIHIYVRIFVVLFVCLFISLFVYFFLCAFVCLFI